MPRRVTEGSIQIVGFAKLRRDLKRMDVETNKRLSDYLKVITRQAATDAKRNLISRSKHSRGRVSGTIKASVTQRRTSIYSNHPAAGVLEYGGTIRPRGVPIRIGEKGYMRGAIITATDDVETKLAEIARIIESSGGFH